ncbi:MAG: NADH-quinone oxidoreductase subunit NuoE [Methylococcales bacterium]|jgi:NADH-quinone oxidoreductase subunit E
MSNVSKATELSTEEINEINQEVAHYSNKSAAAIEALKIVQKHRRWVSDDSLKGIAKLLDMSADELDGVATFYNLIYRQPVGKQVIHYCDSISCWMLGSDQICQQLSDSLAIKVGETTVDGQYTLLPIVCLGDCDHAPVMMVGDTLHRNLTVTVIQKMFKHYG